jgi:hypothetical protein
MAGSCTTVGAPAQAPGERLALETRGGSFTAVEALKRAQTVSSMAGPCSTAGAPARAPGERQTKNALHIWTSCEANAGEGAAGFNRGC